MFTSYSFSDVSLVLEHPSLGQCVMTGQGVGQIAVTRAQDASRQDVAHDGSVMTTKIGAKNGELSFTLQQTSAAHKWLNASSSSAIAASTAGGSRAGCRARPKAAATIIPTASRCSARGRSRAKSRPNGRKTARG